MSIKALIDTIIQLPDIEMIRQLIKEISNQEKLIFPDPKRLFTLILLLLTKTQKQIIMSGYILVNILIKRLLPLYLENGWGIIGKRVIELLGSEEGDVRKKSEEAILLLAKLTENPEMYCDGLMKGMENGSPLRIMQCIRVFPKLLELYPKILCNKKSVNVVKSLIEKVIGFTTHKITNIERESKSTLVKLYHIKLENLEEVILRLDPIKSEELQVIWEKEVQNEMEAEVQREDLRLEQFPLINNKVFGVVNPLLIQRLLNSTDAQERNTCIVQFSLEFQSNFEQLSKYCNIINRLLLRLLQFKQEEVVEMLHQLYSMSNIKNRIKIQQSITHFVEELGQQKASWRKLIRQFIIQTLPLDTDSFLNVLQKTLASQSANPQWFKTHQILLIFSKTIPSLSSTAPPMFNPLISTLGQLSVKHKVIKVKKECINILGIILAANQQYREMMGKSVDKGVMKSVEQHLESILSENDNEFMGDQHEQVGEMGRRGYSAQGDEPGW